jgi:hypothetical protein
LPLPLESKTVNALPSTLGILVQKYFLVYELY